MRSFRIRLIAELMPETTLFLIIGPSLGIGLQTRIALIEFTEEQFPAVLVYGCVKHCFRGSAFFRCQFLQRSFSPRTDVDD